MILEGTCVRSPNYQTEGLRTLWSQVVTVKTGTAVDIDIQDVQRETSTKEGDPCGAGAQSVPRRRYVRREGRKFNLVWQSCGWKAVWCSQCASKWPSFASVSRRCHLESSLSARRCWRTPGVQPQLRQWILSRRENRDVSRRVET